MKRSTVLLFLMLFVGIITANEQQVMGEIIHLQVRYYDPTLEHEPLKSAPVRIPTIMINDHTLRSKRHLMDVKYPCLMLTGSQCILV